MSTINRRLPVIGHVWSFTRDPLAFLTRCRADEQRVTTLDFAVTRGILLHQPDDIERLCVDRDKTLLKPIWLTTPSVLRLLGRGMVNADGAEWRLQHATAAQSFSPSAIDKVIPTFLALGQSCLGELPTGTDINISELMRRTTLSYVMTFVFGSCDLGIAEQLTPHFNHLMNRFRSKSSFLGLRDVVLPLPPGPKDRQSARVLRSIVRDAVLRQITLGASNPLCTDLNAAANTEHGLETVCEQLLSLLAAGHDSSALTLGWCCFELARHPNLLDTMRREWAASNLSDSAPDQFDTTRLPITLGVIKEALRLYPPIWIMGRKASRSFDFDGIAVSAGDHIIASQWMTHRDPKLFSQPDEFDVSRWLSPRSESIEKYAWFPFGGGHRVCIGYRFAITEMIIILYLFFSKYNLRITCDTMPPVASMTLRPLDDIIGRLSPN